jgi:amino acid adenylation domain-containing protein/non-ribosomal peptide synthase protein (TIGR01720 family)
LVDLEGHGREEIVGDVNVARTVGWFTTIYPVLLEAPVERPAERDAGGMIKSVKEQLRGVPNKGINYGVLRYLCGKKEEMEEAPQAEVSFNYLGRLEQGMGEVEMFKLSTETCGRVRGGRNERRYLLDVEASVTGGRLKVEWEYNERIHRRETIERLAGLYIEALERLIDHCLSQEAGGFTPSDFPLVRLEQKQIDEILREYGQIEDVYALSPMQQGLLFHTLYETEPGIYLEQVSCALRGDFNLDLFELAWRQAIERHPILRTGFRWEGFDGPIQVVLKSARFSIERYDWSDAESADYAQRLGAFLKDDRERGFDLGKAPLMRLAVIRVSHNDYKFIWTSHHLLLDGWSMSLLFKEVFDRYDALCRGGQSQFKPSRPYRDYIAWLKRRNPQDRQNAETFWRLTLKGFSSATPLVVPASAGRISTPSLPAEAGTTNFPTHQELELSLPISLTIALQELAKERQLTLNTFIQGAWALLLGRYSGEDDLVFGSVISGRPPDLKGVETMIGLFINTLPVRAQIPLHATSRSWLEELQDLQSKSRQFEHVSLLQIQEWSEIPRPLPLFESVVVFENYPVAESLEERFEGFAVGDIQLEERASYPLALIAVPGARLQLRIAYDCRRFDACSVVRMSGHLQTLLEQMADHPDRSIIDLRLLTETELEQILFHWNETNSSESPDLLVYQRFEEQAGRTPDATAVVFEGEQLTYGELNRRANQLAHYLFRLGAGPETPVGVLMERSIEMIVGLLGVLKARGVYAPLDPSYPPERLSFMIEDAQVSVLLTRRDGLQSVRCERTVFLDADWGAIAAESAENPSGLTDIDNAAYIIYTSGSSGSPKGVIVTHRGLSNLAEAQRLTFQIAPETRILQFASLSFDASIFEIVMALCAGATLCLARREDLLPSPEFVLRLEEQEVGCMTVPPSFLRALPDAKLPAMNDIIVAGEVCPEEAAIRWAEGRRFYNAYGPTEATVWTTVAQYTEGRGRPPVGRPITNTEVYLLDRYLRPMPPSLTGELYIGGEGLARGYQNRAETTAAEFIPHPFGKSPGTRLYRTGDLVCYLPDRAGAAGGDIEYIGRADHQVKVRGYRVELGEIEAILDGMVRRSAVIVNEDEAGDKRLIAYVEPDSAPLDHEMLREHLRERVPEYMIPALFVPLDGMPLLPNGKIDRRRLSSLSVRPVVDNSTTGQTLSQFEEITANIFSETLGVKQLGKDADFFALGGHSLSAIQVVSRLRENCGVELPIRAVFETPTVKDLAKRVAALLKMNSHRDHRGHREIISSPVVPAVFSVANIYKACPTIGRRRTAPLSPAQLRLWFLDRLEPGSDLYNIPIAVLLEGRLDVAALRGCFNEIVRRHEALRTTFEDAGGEPVQVINPADIFSVSVIDLSDLDAERRAAETERLTRDESRRPFDLTRGPLLRVTILRLEEERHVLSVTMHHVVSDGWSMNVLARETTELYQAFVAGEPSPLPDPPIQYADYAIWQRESLTGGFLGSQLDYWKGSLQGAPARLTLPQDKSRPKVQTYNGATRSLYLSEELSDALMALSRREGVTLFMTLLSGFTTLLSRYANQDDIVVGAPVANRTMIETESLIGFFVNTLALRTDLSGNPSFEELLRRVRETTIDAYARQDFPFEKLVEELQPERDPSRAPLFQVLFSLDDVRASDWRLPGVTATALEMESATSKFDLSLLMENTGGKLQAAIEYNTDLFDESTILRTLGHLENLLRNVVTDPSWRIAEIPLLTGVEEYQLLVQWNETKQAPSPDALIHELFEGRSAGAPDAAALVYDDLHLTYHELNRRADVLADHLRGMGVGCETLVGLFIHRSVEMIVSLLGILKAGGTYLPLDPEYPLERLKLILDGAEPAVVLTELRLLERLPEERRQRALCVSDRLQSVQDMNWDRQTEVRSTGASAAYVMYTSGSTGRPKGVAVTHRGVVRLVHKPNYVALGPEEVFLQLAPVSFDASTFEIWGSLLNGARLVLAPSHQSPQASGITLESLGRIIREAGVTTLWLTAGLWRLMVEHKLEDLRQVRQLLAGGDVLSVSHVENFLSSAEASALINGYGPTENTTFTCCHAMKGREQFISSVPIGRPISETQVYALDGNRRPVPQGVVGELYIGGAGLARGYFGRPDLTAGEFMPNPFSGEPGARMYRSGDLARHLQNGDLEFIGRIDEQVKVRGFRVEPLEVEAAMAEFPGIKESVILAVGKTDERRLAAYFTTIKDSSLSIKELRSYLRSKLPEYMIPSTFAHLSQLPLTPNGKIDRKALPALTPENLMSEESFIAPRDIVEEQLARMWSELLGLERVGVYDNFFDLGGHSLLATRLQSRVQEAFQIEIPLHSFFEAGTVAEAARALIAREAEPGRTEKIARLLKKIEAMSIDEIKGALREE